MLAPFGIEFAAGWRLANKTRRSKKLDGLRQDVSPKIAHSGASVLAGAGDFEGVDQAIDAGKHSAGLNGNLLFVERANAAAERDFTGLNIDR